MFVVCKAHYLQNKFMVDFVQPEAKDVRNTIYLLRHMFSTHQRPVLSGVFQDLVAIFDGDRKEEFQRTEGNICCRYDMTFLPKPSRLSSRRIAIRVDNLLCPVKDLQRPRRLDFTIL